MTAHAYHKVRADKFSYGRRAAFFAAIDPEDPAFHFALRALLDLERFGFDIDDPDIVDRAVARGREIYDHTLRLQAIMAERAGRSCPPSEGQLVYYVRIGNRCKIGYTSNMASRMSSINPEEILATEPGTLDLEKIRHQEFRQLRTHGEWFRLEEPLTSHIERLRAAA